MKIIDVRVPFLGTNDDIATVVAVNQSSGSFVERGIDLFCIETTKSVISVPAEQEGYCYHSLGISDKVRVGQLIGCIADRVLPASEFKAVLEREALGEEASVKRFTDKALKLARFMRLTREIISANPSSMIINTELVEAYAASIVNEFSLQEKKLLEGCCSDSTGLVIVGNGHGNRALGMHINAAHNKKVKVFLDYSNKLKPRSSESAIEAPIFLGNRFIENCSGLLVHVPYEILVELKPYLDVANPPFFSFIHPNATVAPSVKIGRSVSIMAGAVIEPGSIINDYCFIGNNVTVGSDVEIGIGTQVLNAASVAHNSTIGEGCVISDGARIAGRVKLGRKVKLGLNACVNSGAVVADDFRVKSNGLVQ